jgi:hypothetical protein
MPRGAGHATCLIVADDGLTDRRAIRAVRLSWEQIADFRVQRPGWLWGGFCVVAGPQDGTDVDLLSARAYTRHLPAITSMSCCGSAGRCRNGSL